MARQLWLEHNRTAVAVFRDDYMFRVETYCRNLAKLEYYKQHPNILGIKLTKKKKIITIEDVKKKTNRDLVNKAQLYKKDERGLYRVVWEKEFPYQKARK